MNPPHAHPHRRSSERLSPRRCCGILLACIGVALLLGAVARSASARAPSFGRLILETDDGASAAMGDLNHDGRTDIVITSYPLVCREPSSAS